MHIKFYFIHYQVLIIVLIFFWQNDEESKLRFSWQKKRPAGAFASAGLLPEFRHYCV